MKNTLEGINSRLGEAEKLISDLGDKITVRTQAEHQKEENFKNEKSLKDLWENIKCNNIHIIGVTEGEDSEQKDNLFEYWLRIPLTW